ncbi:PAS domain-containing protein [Leptospira semungkisensis]|uniref:PAS domain-containing protein n=1 Tax=Leptospira semungkisensis TaxID=2484985 RepID=A0A4R9G841_9LEPT|nr:adenylate/guanylate cyclase domain-containing protein [Leptospira semungkisensis]TGK07734.1 PAS domain-containing protein [Leptospira semungkisensis]
MEQEIESETQEFIEKTDLKELLSQYKDAIDKSTIVSMTNLHGKITYANDEFCRLSKYNRDELVGQPHNIVRHPDMPKEAFRNMWATIKAGRIWKGVVENRAKDGSKYIVNTTIIPIKNPDGTNKEYIGIRSDISELVFSQNKVRSLLEASSKFVPSQFLNELKSTDLTSIHPGEATNLKLTVLFADIRGFTSISEKFSSAEIFRNLNRYIAHMEPVVTKNSGFIDKFIGDGLMALFHNGEDAVRAGKEMLEELEQFNKEFTKEGNDKIRIGIGIHTGPVALGTVGTEARMNTTVIGDTVNVAARMEKLTKKAKVPLLFTEETFGELSSTFSAKKVGRSVLRGRINATTLYTLD